MMSALATASTLSSQLPNPTEVHILLGLDRTPKSPTHSTRMRQVPTSWVVVDPGLPTLHDQSGHHIFTCSNCRSHAQRAELADELN